MVAFPSPNWTSARRIDALPHQRRGASRAFHNPFAGFALIDDKRVVVTKPRPGTRRNILELGKLPVGHICFLEAKKITHGRRDIEPSTLIQIRLRALVSENILPVIGPEWSGIFPLCVDRTSAFSNRDPAVLAH